MTAALTGGRLRVVDGMVGADHEDIGCLGEAGDPASKASDILRRLRSDILNVKLVPGVKLPLKALTVKYQIGLIPLREALCQLAGDGLVILESQRGFRVAPTSISQFADIAAIRRSIESIALGRSIEQGDDAWLRNLHRAGEALAGDHERAGGGSSDDRWNSLCRGVHLILMGACASSTLFHLCGQAYDQFDRYRRSTLPAHTFTSKATHDYRELIALALRRERKKAIERLVRHIDDVAADVIRLFVSVPKIDSQSGLTVG